MDAAFADATSFVELDGIFVKVEQLEQSLGEIEHFYLKLKKKHPNPNPNPNLAEARLDVHLSQAATQAKRVTEISNEICEVDMQLEQLRQLLLHNYRKITTQEKRKLSAALTKLSPQHLCKALEIVAENNPSFQATAEEVDLDIDAQSETTLWRLKFFVKGALEVQAKSSASTGGGNNQNHTNNSNKRKKRDL